ncbi:MAG: hypothetical protein PHW29_03090 [Flavobacterium sp.]|nr:hypothetical protein [Flavobacterium sp.]
MKKISLILGMIAMITIVSCKEKEDVAVPAPETQTETSNETSDQKTTTVSTEAKDSTAIKISTDGVNVTTKDGKTKTSVNVSGGDAKVEIKK